MATLSANPESGSTTRRTFLQAGAGAAVIAGLYSLGGRLAQSKTRPEVAGISPYGPLFPVKDANTGLALIKLPEKFHYRTFSWAKDPLSDGTHTPGSHDGMAAVSQVGSMVTLIRNHERSGKGVPIGNAANAYDPVAIGGCTTLVYDTANEKLLNSRVSLSGTLQNCAGGPTPWGTWLSCEEHVGDPLNKEKDGKLTGYTRDHGWVFEVKPELNDAQPVPLVGLGRFVHEAVAIDPATGIVYLTEDSNPAGFYRFIPNTPGDLISSGKLEMLAAVGRADTRKRIPANAEYDVKWVPIADPTRAHTPKSRDGKGVFNQGVKLGGSSFARLEGVFYTEGRLVITATSGGNASQGQVWEYTPGQEKLRLLFESPSKEVLNMPDNLCATPQGCVVLCEDGGRPGQRLHGLMPTGELFPFAENTMQLKGEKNGFKGDLRGGEWSGVCFSLDGKTMFANLQTPGITMAITGPWEDGPF